MLIACGMCGGAVESILIGAAALGTGYVAIVWDDIRARAIRAKRAAKPAADVRPTSARATSHAGR